MERPLALFPLFYSMHLPQSWTLGLFWRLWGSLEGEAHAQHLT